MAHIQHRGVLISGQREQIAPGQLINHSMERNQELTMPAALLRICLVSLSTSTR
jgi:hypothetical protein